MALYETMGSQSPSVWWRQDRGWLVATEVDLDSTYVAGSDDVIASLVTNDRLEVLPIPVDAGITFDSDHLNHCPRTTPNSPTVGWSSGLIIVGRRPFG